MINLIAAIDEQSGFGKDGKIPWHYPEDLANFKHLTEGAFCIMGRKTYEDMLSYFKKDVFLPGRFPVVVSTTLNHSKFPNVTFKNSIQEAVEYCKNSRSVAKDTFLIGGSDIFEYGLDGEVEIASISVIPGTYDCDRFFPKDKLYKNYQLIFSELSPETGIKYLTYVRSIK